MSSIRFFFEDIAAADISESKLKPWIIQTIQREGYQLEELNYIFCSDPYLLNINKNYLDHDYYTDIITFNNAESESEIEADIFVSWERVAENAKNLKTPFITELRRVIIHGILHLMGYNDHDEEEKQEMRKKEEACLSLFPE